MSPDIYGKDVLADKSRQAAAYPTVEAKLGLVVLHRSTRFRGAISEIDKNAVMVKSPNSGLEREFLLTPGAFAVEGETVNLVRPTTSSTKSQRTASGSVAVANQKARVAQASRILVEGVHDAELVEKIWGDDLRSEGIVVERLDGIDHLQDVMRELSPGPQCRLGVLVDHLVPGSKESRLATNITSPYVQVTGTPYVDVWQAIRPQVLGIATWPVIPKGQSWKEGICLAFGEPEPGILWRRLLGQVKTWTDLEPDFIGAVEQLIDFVTVSPNS